MADFRRFWRDSSSYLQDPRPATRLDCVVGTALAILMAAVAALSLEPDLPSILANMIK